MRDAEGPDVGPQGSVKLDTDTLPDGKVVPKLHVRLPNHDAPTEFRNASFVIPDDGDGDDPRSVVQCPLINGLGEIILDATTNEPIILAAPPAIVRFDDQKHVSVAQAAKMTGVSRQTIWRAVSDGKLKVAQVDGKHTRYSVEDQKPG